MSANTDDDAKHDGDMPKSIYIRDFPFPAVPWFDSRKIEAALDYMPKDGDIILCSYPKTGTTWLSFIIWMILHNGKYDSTLNDIHAKHIPFMEMTGTEPVEALEIPRFYKNHFPYHMMKINKNAKYIYIYRNPIDTLVSFYHFFQKVHESFIEFETFFKNFLTGNICYGSYFDHLISFLTHKEELNVLLVSYEDLHEDIKAQVLKIAKFLGDKYLQSLLEDDSLLQNILTVTEFKYMKEHVSSTQSVKLNSVVQKRDIGMFRKGVVGDGKNLLSSQQIAELKAQMSEKMKDTEFTHLWTL